MQEFKFAGAANMLEQFGIFGNRQDAINKELEAAADRINELQGCDDKVIPITIGQVIEEFGKSNYESSGELAYIMYQAGRKIEWALLHGATEV